MPEPPPASEIICHRCGSLHQSGDPLYYIVEIRAYLMPGDLHFSKEDLDTDFHAEFHQLMKAMQDRSPQELMDDVYRQLTIHLCPACYRHWIEQPAGTPNPTPDP